jgi:hypothetical protein
MSASLCVCVARLMRAAASGVNTYFGPAGVRTAHSADDAVNDVIDYAKFSSRSYQAVIHVYDEAGNMIETHKHTGDFKEP